MGKFVIALNRAKLLGVIRLNLKCKSSTKKCQTYLRRLVKGHTVKQKAPDRAKIQDMSHVDNVCDLILSPPLPANMDLVLEACKDKYLCCPLPNLILAANIAHIVPLRNISISQHFKHFY